jgi:hypothetical protein
MGLNSKTGKMETTLVIDWGGDAGQTAKPKWNECGRGRGVKLLRRIIMEQLVDCGEQIMPLPNGPMVRALKLKLVEGEYFKSYATPTDTDEAAKRQAKRMAFRRALEQAGDKVVTREIGDIDYIWLSQKGPGETAAATKPQPTDEEGPSPA